MKKSLHIYGVFYLLVVVLAGCKPGVPSEYLQPQEMEDILYDYHVADGMAFAENDYSELPYRRMLYRKAALRKHGVTEAQFDSSMVYYYRHTEKLHEIYGYLAKRLNNDAIALGATANELSQFGNLSSQGDTATVWRYEQAVILLPQAPYSIVSFDVKADTAYHKGDKMILSFDNQFIFQDGIKDGIAMLAVTFDNDSTAAQTTHISSDTHYSLQISDDNNVGIKHVRGFIYLGKTYNDYESHSPALKLMCVSNMRLFRMRSQIIPPEESTDQAQELPIAPHSTGLSVSGRPRVSAEDNTSKPTEEASSAVTDENRHKVQQWGGSQIAVPRDVP